MSSSISVNSANNHGSKINIYTAVTKYSTVKRWMAESNTWGNKDYKHLSLKLTDYKLGCQSATAICHSEIYGQLNMEIYLTEDYPFNPPRFFIKNAPNKMIQHPFVHRETGEICSFILSEKWSPSITIATSLMAILLDVIDCASKEVTIACSCATNTHRLEFVFQVANNNGEHQKWDDAVRYIEAESHHNPSLWSRESHVGGFSTMSESSPSYWRTSSQDGA